MKTTLLLTAVLALASVAASAQVGRPSIGLRAGINFQNLNGKDGSGDQFENKLRTGFNVGLNLELPVADDFYVQPGLLLSTKGARNNDVAGSEDLKYKTSYLEIPINLLYKPVLGEGRLLLGFGPYAAFAVGGQVQFGDVERDIEFESDITATQAASGTPYQKRFDAGANLLFGYEFASRVSAQLNAQLGLVNINPKVGGSSDESTLKNTGFGVSLGYRF